MKTSNTNTNWMPANSPYRRSHTWQYVGAGLFFILTIAGILFSVYQLPVVRDFFSQASGEEANIQVDVQAVIGPMPRPWRSLAQGGEEHNWRLAPVAASVKALQPQLIRIDHIYDFYDIVQGTPGNLTFDFSKFDLLLNDITAAGATPYIALSYMPPAISRGDIVDMPHRWEDWQLTIQKTIEHVSGTRNIPNVHYEVWNEPDLFGGWKYYGDKNYITMYNYAARGAAQAQVRQNFKIGGPAITALYKNWFDAMMKNAINNNVRLDFFSWHRYSTDIDQFRRDMADAQTWIANYPQLEPTMEFHITEWGHDSENDPGYDGNYGAAHTVAGAIEMVGVVDKGFVFEIQDGKDPAGQANWGRWGLLTHNEFGAKPKPRYRGLRMLDKIGNQRLQLLGKGSWVKGLAAQNDNGAVQVVLANFDRRGSHAETVPITFGNILPGNYLVTKEFLNGQTQQEKIATTAATLATKVTMTANSVAFITLQME